MVREVDPPSREGYGATSATRVKIGPIEAGLAAQNRNLSHLRPDAGPVMPVKSSKQNQAARDFCAVCRSAAWTAASLLQGEEGFFLCHKQRDKITSPWQRLVTP